MHFIGHRGMPAHHPENSITGFLAAINNGAWGIELDVQAAADGTPIVIHDATLERTTNGHGLIKNFLPQALSHITLSNGEAIPALEDVLEALPPHITIFTEVKDAHATRQTALLLEKFCHKFSAVRLPVISFFPSILKEAQQYWPEAQIGLTLMHDFKAHETAQKIHLPAEPWPFFKESAAANIAAAIKAMQPEWINFHWQDASAENVAQIHAYGIQTTAWTCNSQQSIAHAQSCNITAIMTDDVSGFLA